MDTICTVPQTVAHQPRACCIRLVLITDIETDFNQRKPPHRTVCVAIDLTAVFDTVSHDTLISKIAGLSLPPAINPWLFCYLRGRQATTSFRATKSSKRIVGTGVHQKSKLSLSLFNYYITDMPRPTPPVNTVCYADDITVWATGPKVPQLESMINNYLTTMHSLTTTVRTLPSISELQA